MKEFGYYSIFTYGSVANDGRGVYYPQLIVLSIFDKSLWESIKKYIQGYLSNF